MGYNDGGQICLDKNGAIFIRYGPNILKISAMVVWDGMLVCGCGMAATQNYPNLLYLDTSRYQEKGAISGGTAADNTITKEWTSGSYVYDERRELRRVEVIYENKKSYQHGSSSGFKFYYRVDNAVDTSLTDQITSEYLPLWTELTTVSKTLSNTATDKSRIHKIRPGVNLKLDAHIWQFQITSDYDFKILGFQPYLLPKAGMEDR